MATVRDISQTPDANDNQGMTTVTLIHGAPEPLDLAEHPQLTEAPSTEVLRGKAGLPTLTRVMLPFPAADQGRQSSGGDRSVSSTIQGILRDLQHLSLSRIRGQKVHSRPPIPTFQVTTLE